MSKCVQHGKFIVERKELPYLHTFSRGRHSHRWASLDKHWERSPQSTLAQHMPAQPDALSPPRQWLEQN